MNVQGKEGRTVLKKGRCDFARGKGKILVLSGPRPRVRTLKS